MSKPKKYKLSSYQVGILGALAGGAAIHYMDGLHAYYFIDTAPHRGVRPETVSRLFDLGLIAPEGNRRHLYVISPTGLEIARSR